MQNLNGRLENIFCSSLNVAVREQLLTSLYEQLAAAVPDIKHQYSQFKVDSTYLERKIRAVHAFQISLVCKAIELFKLNPSQSVVVDIGDSAGTHLQYLKAMFGHMRTLSINLDPMAVERIKAKGLEAQCIRAEDLHKQSIKADIFLLYEVLEHLLNPLDFLHNLSTKTEGRILIVTVPYTSSSHVALRHIRRENKQKVYAENTHIFELSPEDWKLVFKHCGWRPRYEQIYYQYPKKSFLRFTKMLWKKADFEGFWGVILERDHSWSQLYSDW